MIIVVDFFFRIFTAKTIFKINYTVYYCPFKINYTVYYCPTMTILPEKKTT